MVAVSPPRYFATTILKSGTLIYLVQLETGETLC